MDSSLFCWLSLRPPIFNSSLFTSFGFFTLRSSLFTSFGFFTLRSSLFTSFGFFTLRSSLFTSFGFFTLLLAFPSAADFQFFTLHLTDALEEG